MGVLTNLIAGIMGAMGDLDDVVGGVVLQNRRFERFIRVGR